MKKNIIVINIIFVKTYVKFQDVNSHVNMKEHKTIKNINVI